MDDRGLLYIMDASTTTSAIPIESAREQVDDE